MDRAYVLAPADIEQGVYLGCQTEIASDVALDWAIPASGSGSRAASVA